MDSIIKKGAALILLLVLGTCAMASIKPWLLEKERVRNEAERRERQRKGDEELNKQLALEQERRSKEETRQRTMRLEREKSYWVGSKQLQASRKALNLPYPEFEDVKRRESVEKGRKTYREQREAEQGTREDFGAKSCLEFLLIELRQHSFIHNTPSKRRETVALINKYREPGQPRYTMEDHIRETKEHQAAFRVGLHDGFLRELEATKPTALAAIIETGKIK